MRKIGKWKRICRLFVSFAKTTVRLSSTGGGKKAETMTSMIFGAGFDTELLSRHVDEVEDCTRLLLGGKKGRNGYGRIFEDSKKTE